MTSPEYSSRQEQPTRKTILIIEDDEAIGYFLTTAIRTETPYLPLLLPNGNQALQQIREKKTRSFTTGLSPSWDKRH
jgi:CheY-like chemotaxis protein